MAEQFPHDRTHPEGWHYIHNTENDGLEHNANDDHNIPAALSPDHHSDHTDDNIPADGHHPQPTDEQHGPQAGNQLPAPDDNQEEALATTDSGTSGSETGDHVDNPNNLPDINNDNQAIDNNFVMDNLAVHAPHDQLDNPTPERQTQYRQSPEVIVQRNPIQHLHRTHPFPQDSPHLQVDPEISFRMPPLPQAERPGYQPYNTTDFPPLPTRFPPITHASVKMDNLPFKLQSFSGNPDQDPEEFINNFKLSAEVLGWLYDKQPGIFHMCLQGAAKVWFQNLEHHTRTNIDKIFCAFLLRFKPLGLDWTREASFQPLRQMPQESAQQFANRVLEKGTKIGKSDKDLMNQFVRGLSNECRTHTIALGPNSFAQAARTASLFESAKTFGQDDSAAVLHKQETSTPPQDIRTFKQVNSKLKCAYCKREGHHISECRTRESNNRRRQQSNNTQWAEQPQQRPQQGGHNRQPNNLRSVNSDIVCYSCNGRGHIARDCRRLQNPRPNYQSNNNYRPKFQK